MSRSLDPEDHELAELVKFLMDVGTCPFDGDEILARVVAENVEDAECRLQTAQRGYDMAKNTYDMLVEKEWNATIEYANIPEKLPAHKIKGDETPEDQVSARQEPHYYGDTSHDYRLSTRSTQRGRDDDSVRSPRKMTLPAPKWRLRKGT